MLTIQENITEANTACQRYHWESYSVVRSLYEELNHQVPANTDILFALGVGAVVHNISKVVRIGLSDPNLFATKNAQECDLYVTNSKRISEALGYYHMPCFSDKRYFKPMAEEKETDILFIGVRDHPFIPHRREWIEQLQGEGFNIKCFGQGWKNGFIEGEELIREINKAHLCLDITTDVSAMSSRIFQSSMCGTPVITFGRPDLEELFDDEEIFTYVDYPDLSKLLRLLLQEPAYLKRVGKMVMESSQRDHDVSIRVKNLLEHLNDKGML